LIERENSDLLGLGNKEFKFEKAILGFAKRKSL